MKLVVLNHKMNLYLDELPTYFSYINKVEENLIIAPSNIYLLEFIRHSIHPIASQDVCYFEDGNHTGKVSWSQIKSLGIHYSLIGHSEKNDSMETTIAKVNICLENNITPILCFGNQSGENIISVLEKLNIYNKDIIYAYEPIYNIANDNIDYNDILNNITSIYNHLKEKGLPDPCIIYGGGLNPSNVKKIYDIPILNGIMIGSKSSDINKLDPILLNIKEK